MCEIQKLRGLRLQHGLTQKQIAAKLCCAPLTLLRWENGQRSPRPVYRMAIQKLIKQLSKKPQN
jgi:transcriptional regulator with XRE-family HTH domain